jgi:hypothetical protein
MEVRMQMIAKVAVFGLGVLASGGALADDSFGGSPLYNGQYAYDTSPSYYGTYPTSYSNYPGYPYYYGSYPGYGWYPGAPAYAWDPTAPWHPYSHSNPRWVPYAGWR